MSRLVPVVVAKAARDRFHVPCAAARRAPKMLDAGLSRLEASSTRTAGSAGGRPTRATSATAYVVHGLACVAVAEPARAQASSGRRARWLLKARAAARSQH